MKPSKSTLDSAIQLRYSWAIIHSNEVQFTICGHLAHTYTSANGFPSYWKYKQNIYFLQTKNYQLILSIKCLRISRVCELLSMWLVFFSAKNNSGWIFKYNANSFNAKILTTHFDKFFSRISYRHHLHGTLTNKCIKWKQNIEHKMKKPKPIQSATQHLLGVNHFRSNRFGQRIAFQNNFILIRRVIGMLFATAKYHFDLIELWSTGPIFILIIYCGKFQFDIFFASVSLFALFFLRDNYDFQFA